MDIYPVFALPADSTFHPAPDAHQAHQTGAQKQHGRGDGNDGGGRG